jgi:hypothetical protein
VVKDVFAVLLNEYLAFFVNFHRALRIRISDVVKKKAKRNILRIGFGVAR